jgi:hypothetical protein
MADTEKTSHLASLGPALIALLGVAIGGGLTGYFQTRVQKEASALAAMQETSKNSREFNDKLASLSADYLNRLALFGFLFDASAAPDKGRLMAQYMEFQKVALDLSLRTSLPASLKILQSIQVALKVVNATNGGKQIDEVQQQYSKAFAETYLAVYAEVARYRLTSGPDATQQEVVTTLMQLLMSPVGDRKQ